MKIRNLFDTNRDIYRTIEKVITYGASQENRLKAEISEYVVTDSIEEQFRKLLDRMQLAMDTGGENEIGVWVSGFYGSGKSSFTKYLGLALDSHVMVDGVPFIKHLQDRLKTPQVKALLSTVAQRFPAAVVMLDLASEMLTGATMEDVSTVLYFKVLQWAGYSRNLKVAALERRLEKDGRFEEFEKKVATQVPGMKWSDLQNDPLVVDGVLPQIAHEMYPSLLKTPTSFSLKTEDFFQFETDRVQEMIDIVREKSGKQHIIFVVDEVGQYIASRDHLILNLDGLAKNLKRLGNGKVWIISTAQQTLTEDDPRAALNSDKLYKLHARFPIQIDLESSDIKEICYSRLLGKSSAGETELGKRFDTYGQALRHNTKLANAKYYDSDFTRKTFIDLYPFLPAHFDILLHLLGALAKSTGGIGLRSAIKVIQDILVEAEGGRLAVADQPVGWLATTVTLYDTLDKDIRRAFPSIYHALTNTCILFHQSKIHEEAAKSIAILQILGNLPITEQNLASLMHPSIDAPSSLAEVQAAVKDMLDNPMVPLGQKEGSLCFLSEKLRDIELERGGIPPRSVELQRIFNDALKECFNPLPRVSRHNTLSVTSGLKAQSGATITSLAGDGHPIQTIVEFTSPADYDSNRTRLLDDSRSHQNQNTIFLLARTISEDGLALDIYRCEEIARLHRNDPDQEVKEYCASQGDRAESLRRDQLTPSIKRSLTQGSFVFRGEPTAVTALNENLNDALTKMLSNAAGQVFDRYSEAAVRADTSLAEKFLKAGTPAAITSAIDPLGLVEVSAGSKGIKTDHKAIVSIRDYIERSGTVEGKRLLEHFSDPPFGWSPDTTRYILAAMLIAGEIKLKVSGRQISGSGQQAIDALKTNKSFGPIGISVRMDKPSIEVLSRAAGRLSDLIGETVHPLEQDISKAAVRQFAAFQREYGPLAGQLAALNLAGAERARTLLETLSNVLQTDGFDVPQRLGAQESSLYDDLKWAAAIKRALDSGLETTIRSLQEHRREIQALPNAGIPGELQVGLANDLDELTQRLRKDDFHLRAADLNSTLRTIEARVRDAATRLSDRQKQRVQEGIDDLQRLPEWRDLTQEEQANAIDRIERLVVQPVPDLAGLKTLMSAEYTIGATVSELKESVRRKGQERLKRHIEEEGLKKEPQHGKLRKTIRIPSALCSAAQLEDLIRQLQEIKVEMELHAEIEITIQMEN